MTLEEVQAAAIAKNPQIVVDYINEEIALAEADVTLANANLATAQSVAQNEVDAANARLQALQDTKAQVEGAEAAPVADVAPVEGDPAEEAAETPDQEAAEPTDAPQG